MEFDRDKLPASIEVAERPTGSPKRTSPLASDPDLRHEHLRACAERPDFPERVAIAESLSPRSRLAAEFGHRAGATRRSRQSDDREQVSELSEASRTGGEPVERAGVGGAASADLQGCFEDSFPVSHPTASG